VNDRSHYIGGSDIGAILGVSKFPNATPLAVYMRKAGLLADEPIDPQREKMFKRGKRMEPVVLAMLAEERGLDIIATNQRYTDAEYPFMACEIDAETKVAGEHVNIEIKTTSPFAAGQWGEEGTDEIDMSYAAQAMWGLMVTGRRRTIFGVLVGSDNLLTYEIKRDEDLINGMREAAIHFWRDHIEAHQPPAPVNIDDAMALFKRKPASVTEASAEVMEMAENYRRWQLQAKMANEAADELKFKILAAMLGDDEVRKAQLKVAEQKGKHLLTFGGDELLTVRYQESRSIDAKGLRKAHPKIVEEFERVSSFYVVAPTRRKKT